MLHGLIPMTGRDPEEKHRAATPLELLYDLTLVVAFSLAGSQFAHALSVGHILPGLLSFAFCLFAIVWAWMTYTYFASAYDTDDWGFRLATLVQMLGVIILALGIGDLFRGFDEGYLDNRVMVMGYVIMRASMIFLWLRAARADPQHRPMLTRYALLFSATQVGWVLTAFAPLQRPLLLTVMLTLYVLEVGGTWVIDKQTTQIPWHSHHLAERFSLLGIITFGEVVLGTTTSVEALVSEFGWSLSAAGLAFSGIMLVFGMWWNYFSLPHEEVLEHRRELVVAWAYAHLLTYAGIAATGAGLHAVAYFIEENSSLTTLQTTLSVAIPLGLYSASLYSLFWLLLPGKLAIRRRLLVLQLLCMALALGVAATGAAIAWPMLLLTLTPWITVVGYEFAGHREIAARLQQL